MRLRDLMRARQEAARHDLLSPGDIIEGHEEAATPERRERAKRGRRFLRTVQEQAAAERAKVERPPRPPA